MDELVQLVVKKTGISADAARQAITTVLEFLKKKLPAPIASQIDSVLGDGGPTAGLAKGLSDLIGKN